MKCENIKRIYFRSKGKKPCAAVGCVYDLNSFFFLSPIYTKVDEGHAHDDDIYVRLRRSCAKCFDN
jgi:hypothetical protein